MSNFADNLFKRRFQLRTNLVLNLQYSYEDLPEALRLKKQEEFGKNWAAVSDALVSYGDVLLEAASPAVAAVVFNLDSFLQYGAYGIRALEILIRKADSLVLPIIVDSRIAAFRRDSPRVPGESLIAPIPGWEDSLISNINAHALTILPYHGLEMVDSYLNLAHEHKRGLVVVLNNIMNPDWQGLATRAQVLLGKEVERSGLMVWLENEQIPLLEHIYMNSLSALISFPEHFDNMQAEAFWDNLKRKTKVQSFVVLSKEAMQAKKLAQELQQAVEEERAPVMRKVKDLLDIYREMFYV